MTQEQPQFDPFSFLDGGDTPEPTATATLEPLEAQSALAEAAASVEQVLNEEEAKVAGETVEEVSNRTRRRTTKITRQPLFIDIETVPDESRIELFGLDPLPTPAEYLAENDSPAPSEMLRGTIDDVKAAIAKALAAASSKKLPRVVIEAAIKMERGAQKPRKGVIDLFEAMLSAMDGEAAMITAATIDRQKLMSVTPEFCRIVALGWAVGGDPAESMVVGQKSADGSRVLTETDLLARFWQLAANACPVIGYNVAGFDLPVLFVRSILLGVDCSRKLEIKPWGTSDVCDLMTARFPRGGQRKLKDLARLMGIPVPADGVDGSQVAGLFASDPARLGEYVRSDISVTRELWRCYRGTFV